MYILPQILAVKISNEMSYGYSSYVENFESFEFLRKPLNLSTLQNQQNYFEIDLSKK